ncbi:hypothetical protein [Rhizobium sp. BK538]|uniref:hypothetical protein n=1 Tax=Rhizobium sp. BK538 TaxID=2586984 RepID=UPI00161B0425|nr:hypothetical protein [Rhizobium sp. BK538]MBB4170799.1 hypothetical protein [Rhizobium sp. BK538]
MKAPICGRAAKLYNHVVNKKAKFYVGISCDIPTLIACYKEFKVEEAEAAVPAAAGEPALIAVV